jgi:flagellar assembly factor FliW
MLILTRKIGEGIRIGPSGHLVVLEVKGGAGRIGIEAPEGVLIHRDEVLARITEENRKATGTSRDKVEGEALLPSPGPGGAMKVFDTKRFGRIPVEDERIIIFPDGLLGFPASRRFVLLETAENGIFYWLQSLDDPALAFVVIDPVHLIPDYKDRLLLPDWDREFFDPEGPATLHAMAIVTFSETGASANLQGPLLVRENDRLGRQIVLAESDTWLRMPVFLPEEKGGGPS